MNAVVEGDKITFLANQFSYYILVEADLCTDLPESNDDVEIPDVPEIHIHEYVLLNTTDPTCTEKGVATYKCSCGSSYNVETASLGHIEITLSAVESTCCETGLTEGKGCSRCNTVLEAQNIVPKKDHVDSNEDYICDTEGCGFKFEVPKPACDCNCHKDGIAAFFFNFILFFQKLFKANQICSCGEAHY